MPQSRTSKFVPRDCGVALISALLMVALATAAAVAMASRQQIDIRRTTNAIEYDQAYLYVQGVEDWAGQILKRDLQESKADSLDEDWAMDVAIPVDDAVRIAAKMEDMQGRFNVNSLIKNGAVDPAALDRFRCLLDALEVPRELADPVADWLDEDDDVRMGGAEEAFYLGLQPPYRAANGPMTSVSELRMVNGITPEYYAKLEPYLAALPQKAGVAAPLNVSTVDENKSKLIMCLSQNVAPADAEQILKNRGAAGFTSVQDFLQEPAMVGVSPNGLTVSSNYFMVTSHVQVGRSTYTTYSLLERDQLGVRTVMRAQGTY